MIFGCSQYVFILFTVCIHFVHSMYSFCSQHVRTYILQEDYGEQGMGRNAAKGKNYDSHCEAQALLLYLDSILFVICPMRVTFSFSNRFSTFLFDFKSKNLQCSARKGPKCSICPKLCMFQVNKKTGVTIDKTVNEVAWDMCRFPSLK